MLVFLDDSGDPGFRFGHSSSTHVVPALVGFTADAHARRAMEWMQALRTGRRFPDPAAYTFHHSRREGRKHFLRAVAPCVFEVRSLVIDKTALHAASPSASCWRGTARHAPMCASGLTAAASGCSTAVSSANCGARSRSITSGWCARTGKG